MTDTTDAPTVTQVAAYLQMHPMTVRRLAREKKLPARRVGGQWRFPPFAELNRWLAGEHIDTAAAALTQVADPPSSSSERTIIGRNKSEREIAAAYHALLERPRSARMKRGS